ncbi:MAG: coiled-coil domain-containing protein [Janthinobacterium lividum]
MYKLLISLFLIINLLSGYASDIDDERQKIERRLVKQNEVQARLDDFDSQIEELKEQHHQSDIYTKIKTSPKKFSILVERTKTQAQLSQLNDEIKKLKKSYDKSIAKSFIGVDQRILSSPKELQDLISSYFSQILKIRLINKFFEKLTRHYIEENFTVNLRDFKILKGKKYYEPLSEYCDEIPYNTRYFEHIKDIDNFKLYKAHYDGLIYVRSRPFPSTFDYCHHTVFNKFLNLDGFLKPRHIALQYSRNITYEQITKFVKDNPQIESLKLYLQHQDKKRTFQIMKKLATLNYIKSLYLTLEYGYEEDSTLNLALKILSSQVIVDTFCMTQQHITTLFQNSKLTSLMLGRSSKTENNKEILKFLFEKINQKPLKKLTLYNFQKNHIDVKDIASLPIQKLEIVRDDIDTNNASDYDNFYVLNSIAQNNYLESFTFYCRKINLKKFQDFVEKKRKNPLSKLKKLKLFYSNAKLIKSRDEIMNILGDDFEVSFKRI